MDTFEDMPLFGGKPKPKGDRQKRRRQRRTAKTKKRIYKKRSMKYVTDLPLFTWYISPDFEGETADTFRNIIRQFFYKKWKSGEDWNEEELFDFVRSTWDLVPMVTFREFWTKARQSKKGKLAWIDHLDKIYEDEWRDYTKLTHVKKFIRR